jgi:hypothetical protein
VELMPPKSPCLSSTAANTIQRQRRQVLNSIPHHLSDNQEKSGDHRFNTSDGPIIHQHVRSQFTSSRRHDREIDRNDAGDSYFSATQIERSRVPTGFQRKIHDVYVLPVSPALSSSSSTTNTDEIIKTGSSTMPIRSRRHLTSSANRGIENDSFADSPQPKDRTLPRSHGGTLRRIQPPSQSPPVPPTIAHLHFNDIRSPIDNKSLFQHQSATMGLDPDVIALRFSNQKIYGTTQDNHLKKAAPPPVPCRTQKPTALPIGFERLATPPDAIGFRMSVESSPQEDYSEHAWPKPPESMSTSEIGIPPQSLLPSIPYDRLHHDHLIPAVIMRQNSTTNFFHQHRHGEHSMLTESET